jgi:enoyl-CoA hydratase/carnithine racemase
LLINGELMTIQPATDVVDLRRVGPHVAVVTLNRAEARNAINRAVALALEKHVKAIEADPDIRVAILTGSGSRAFCAGADLKEVASGSEPLGRTTADGGFAGFVFAKRSKLWIAAVNGAAVAGGLELVLACDFAIASSDAVFALPEVKRGLVATAGGVYRLPRAVPRGIALEMIATGDSIDAKRACSLGLVNRVVPADAVLGEALRVAEAVSANAPLAVAGALQIARRAHDLDEEQLQCEGQAVMERVMRSEDAREGPRAFSEGRAPRWTGR